MFRISLLGLMFFSVVSVAQGQTPIRLLYGPSVNSIAVFVAQGQGYFKSHGLDVEQR